MKEKAELKNDLDLVDLGDAKGETKTLSPWPPLHPDSYYGYGVEPDAK